MRRPTLDLAVAFNRAVRQDDEWFDEPDDLDDLGDLDDLDRVERALRTIDQIADPVAAAALVAFRVTWTQGFGEGKHCPTPGLPGIERVA